MWQLKRLLPHLSFSLRQTSQRRYVHLISHLPHSPDLTLHPLRPSTEISQEGLQRSARCCILRSLSTSLLLYLTAVSSTDGFGARSPPPSPTSLESLPPFLLCPSLPGLEMSELRAILGLLWTHCLLPGSHLLSA